jgi:hypothetical protein
MTVLYFDKGELSKCVKYFVGVLIKHGILQTKDFVFSEIESASAATTRPNGIMNIYNFQRKRRVIYSVQFRIGSHQIIGISKQLLGIPGVSRY